MTFSCPPGEKAFVYQGTLLARTLKLDASTGQYSWASPEAKALTQVLVTRGTPIAVPSDSVQMK